MIIFEKIALEAAMIVAKFFWGKFSIFLLKMRKIRLRILSRP